MVIFGFGLTRLIIQCSSTRILSSSLSRNSTNLTSAPSSQKRPLSILHFWSLHQDITLLLGGQLQVESIKYGLSIIGVCMILFILVLFSVLHVFLIIFVVVFIYFIVVSLFNFPFCSLHSSFILSLFSPPCYTHPNYPTLLFLIYLIFFSLFLLIHVLLADFLLQYPSSKPRCRTSRTLISFAHTS